MGATINIFMEKYKNIFNFDKKESIFIKTMLVNNLWVVVWFLGLNNALPTFLINLA